MSDRPNYVEAMLPREYLVALGCVVVAWGLVEKGIAYCAEALISEDHDVAQIVTAEADFKRLSNMLGSLHLHRLGSAHPTRGRVEKILKQAEQLKKDRDRLIHSWWGADAPDGEPLRFKETAKAKGGLQRQLEQTDAAPVQALADALRDLYHELGRLGNVLRSELGQPV